MPHGAKQAPAPPGSQRWARCTQQVRQAGKRQAAQAVEDAPLTTAAGQYQAAALVQGSCTAPPTALRLGYSAPLAAGVQRSASGPMAPRTGA